MTDSYTTIDKTGEGFYAEKRSKFLAFAYHVETAENAKKLIQECRKKYYDARHCCWAYVLGPACDTFRVNDDGEPSSTAGRPILGQINSNNLTDILICVVRYYGGVNLGTSGLIVAYRTAAANAIERCEIVERLVEDKITFDFSYPMINGVMRVVKEMDARVISQKFEATCQIVLAIRKSLAEQLRAKLNHLNFE